MVGPEPSRDNAVRVLIVADHEQLALGLGQHLDQAEGMETVASIGSTADVVGAIDAYRPTVVLIDDQTHEDAFELCRATSESRPAVACVILGTGLSIGAEQAAHEAGAVIYVEKSLRGATVTDAVRTAFDTGTHHSNRGCRSRTTGTDSVGIHSSSTSLAAEGNPRS